MKTANEMMNEIGEWADKMFPVHLPDYGVAEELGEIIHCILKREQKIRGMDDDAKFYPAIKDAFADVVIYLLHLCYMRKIALSFETMDVVGAYSKWTDRAFLSKCMRQSAMLCEYMEIVHCETDNGIFRIPAQTLMNTLCYWGKKWDIDVVAAARETWEVTVSKRDWSQNRESADKDVIHESN